jgi:hypothetical protein
MYDTVDGYLRNLDKEILKLKTELEADNPGITEILEQRGYTRNPVLFVQTLARFLLFSCGRTQEPWRPRTRRTARARR